MTWYRVLTVPSLIGRMSWEHSASLSLMGAVALLAVEAVVEKIPPGSCRSIAQKVGVRAATEDCNELVGCGSGMTKLGRGTWAMVLGMEATTGKHRGTEGVEV